VRPLVQTPGPTKTKSNPKKERDLSRQQWVCPYFKLLSSWSYFANQIHTLLENSSCGEQIGEHTAWVYEILENVGGRKMLQLNNWTSEQELAGFLRLIPPWNTVPASSPGISAVHCKHSLLLGCLQLRPSFVLASGAHMSYSLLSPGSTRSSEHTFKKRARLPQTHLLQSTRNFDLCSVMSATTLGSR
jgi:hypothetical protein